MTATSDVDLMIIGSPDLDELTDRVSAAERKLGRPMNYTILTEDQLARWWRRGDRFVASVDAGPTLPVVNESNA